MTTIRQTTAATPAANNKPAANAPAGPVAPQPTVSRDSLQVSRPAASNPGLEALAVLTEASELPKMPRGAEAQREWLLDGFARQMKMSAAEATMRKAWGDGKIDGKTLSVARSRIWAVESQLKEAPAYEATKKEFFGGVIGQANAMLNGLAQFPAPPADKAGKQAWMSQAKTELAKAKEAERIMRDCWMEHKVLPFEEMTAAGRKVWDFEGQIRRVNHELNPPPAPKPGEHRPGTGNPANRPLFELTQQAQKGLDSKNPIGQTVGAVVLPIALMVDLIDLLTRPAQMLESSAGKVSKDGRVEIKSVKVNVTRSK